MTTITNLNTRFGLFRTRLAKTFLFAGMSASLLFIGNVQAQRIKALSNGKIYTFDAKTPSTLIGTPLTIIGIGSGQTLVGIDYRPNTAELIGLGYDFGSGKARLYAINTTTGTAAPIGSNDITLELGSGPVGFDFNPTVDRIRVVGANNKNYRLNPNNGAIAATDQNLKYKTGDVNEGKDPFIGTCAYTNSYIGATSTALYDFDDSLNVFSLQSPPNDGVLNSLAGPSGLMINTVERSSDMDIYFDKATSANTAFFVANPNSTQNDNLYTVNLSTGAATLVGLIGSGLAVQDIAAVIEPEQPVFTGKTIYALTQTNGGLNNNLISFSSENPSVIRGLITLSGLKTGQGIAGMDFRPADGKLYAMGKKPGVDSLSLYTINTTTGVASLVKDTVIVMPLGNGPIAFDFNPVADRIRIVASNGNNYRLNPINLAQVVDTALTYRTGDVNAAKKPFVGSVAYTNSFAGATSTAMYDIDDSLSVLARQNTPNSGILDTKGALGIDLNKADATSDIDIVYDLEKSKDFAFLCANTGTEVNDNLYSIDIATGATTLIGRIGFGSAVRDIACQVTLVTGITQKNKVNFDMQVFPNPASNSSILQLNLEKKSSVLVQIYDYTGKLMNVVANDSFSSGNHQLNLNIEQLAKGIYFVSVVVDQAAQQVSKLVIE